MQGVESEKRLVFRGLCEDPTAAEEYALIPPAVVLSCACRVVTE